MTRNVHDGQREDRPRQNELKVRMLEMLCGMAQKGKLGSSNLKTPNGGAVEEEKKERHRRTLYTYDDSPRSPLGSTHTELGGGGGRHRMIKKRKGKLTTNNK